MDQWIEWIGFRPIAGENSRDLHPNLLKVPVIFLKSQLSNLYMSLI